MKQTLRLPAGGRIDRSRPLQFSFDGRSYAGFEGDTLASALLANGVRTVGRSFKYHRARGVMAAGCDEPNAIVQLESGALTEPNLKATQVALYQGLSARAVNCWPNARWDAFGFLQWFKPLMPAGFYYKTFMRPDWHWYEGSIRAAAGLGSSPRESDPDVYDKRHASCDVLVVGAGPAGLGAALAAAHAGARVMLLDDKAEPGGCLLYEPGEVRGESAGDWLRATTRALARLPNVTVLNSTTAFGYYDHNHVLALQHCAGSAEPGAAAKQRLLKIRARDIVLATGAIERPLVFPNNDRPSILLAGAAQQYLHRYAVIPGRRAMVATTHDSAYAVAFELQAAGVRIAAIADGRAQAPAALAERARSLGIEVLQGCAPTDTSGHHGIESVEVHAVDAAGVARKGTRRSFDVDALLVSGGWNPTVHLFSQSGGSLRYDEGQQSFVPARSVQQERSVGAAAGFSGDFAALINEGQIAGLSAARRTAPSAGVPGPGKAAAGIKPLWEVDVSALGRPSIKSWCDFLSDVTSSDLRIAVQENFRSVEHLKRYTTTGMAADQGKTSNVNAIGIVSRLLGNRPDDVGTTRFRPPFDPVTFGAVAGRNVGRFYQPCRQLPTHQRLLEAGAVIEDYGRWLRPACFPRDGEDEHAAVRREVHAARNGASLMDASPLGKILVQGPDAAEFLHRMYVNNIRSLKPGFCRYGLMLGEDGIVMDDGIISRLGEQTYLVGTTSGKAERVAEWFEEWLQCEWVELDVVVEPVTTQWATLTLAGPKAREVLARLGATIDLSAASFPHMTVRSGTLGGVPIRIARVSFTGELSYEISVPFSHGLGLWDALMDAGQHCGITPIGIEAVMVLRVEKGFLHVGSDTDGMTMPQDIGFGEIMSKKPGDFVGRRSAHTPEGLRPDRRQLVGLELAARREFPKVGAHIVGADFRQAPYRSQGWVTSSVYSPTLGRQVLLAMVQSGRQRIGERVQIFDGGHLVPAVITNTAAFDPANERINA